MAVATDYYNVVQKLYVAYFGRPADPTGLQFAANMLAGANAPTTSEGFVAAVDSNPAVKALLEGFGNSPESQAFYSGSALETRIGQIYTNVLGRTAEAGGLAYWANEINSGRLSLAKAAFIILQAAEKHPTGDGLTVMTKVTAATAFTSALDQPSEVAAYSSANAAAAARALLASVNKETPLSSLVTLIDTTVAALGSGAAIPVPTPAPTSAPSASPSPAPSPAAPAPAPGTTQALTTATDALVGGTGNDTFTGNIVGTAAASTYQAADTINGGDGTDTINLTITSAAPTASPIAAATLTGVEIVSVMNLSANAQTVDVTKFTGATQFNADRNTGTGALTFGTSTAAGLSSSQTAGVIGDGAALNGAVTFNYGITVPSATLNIAGGTRGGNITLAGGMTSVTVNSTAAANTVGTLTLPGGVSTVTINASTNFAATLAGLTITSSGVTVNGAASNVNLGTLTPAIASVNASGMASGGITATLGTTSSQLVATVTGGGGDDTITAASATFAGSVNAGSGTDTLIVTNSAHLTSALGARYTGFEFLQVNTGVTADATHLSGITGIKMGGTVTVTNLSAAQAANIQLVANATPTLSLANATGGSDVVKITASDGLATVSTLSLTTPNLANIEQLELTAVDNLSLSATSITASALQSITLKGAGAITFNPSASTMTGLTTIDASGSSGGVTVSAANITASAGLAVSGGSGFDTLTGSPRGDVLSGGGGQNRFVFSTASTASSGVASATNFDTISDFRAGLNNIIDHGSAITVTAGGTGAQGQAFIAANGVATFNVEDDTLQERVTAVASVIATAGRAAVWQQGGDAYLFIGGDTTASAGTPDVLIKLTGVMIGASGIVLNGSGDISAL